MLEAVPLELKESKEFVDKYHRHHGSVHRDKFRVGCSDGKRLVGVANVGRPVARSAQPDIIRCKDCKWYGRADKRRFYRGMDCLQKRIDTIVPDRDFCSKAERKQDEAD